MNYNPTVTKLVLTPEFDAWLSRLRDRQAATAIAGRLGRARLGNLGHWRAVGDGISEMKIDVGKGYRVYFTQRGHMLIIVLCGGTSPHRLQISNAPRPSRKHWSFEMKVSELTEFDASKYLKDENDYRLYLAQAFEGGDPVEIQAALGDLAKARGMTALARESGIAREALYRALSKRGNAEFATIMKVIAAMGLHLTLAKSEIVPKAAGKTKPATRAVAAKKARPATKRGGNTTSESRPPSGDVAHA